MDTLEWQEKLLHNSVRVLSGMAYGKYCDKGRGLIVIELRRCWAQENLKGIWWASLGLIKPIEGLEGTIEMVESYEPLLEYVIGFDAYEKKLGSRVWIRDLVMSH